ncbi:MAG: FeoB-associated Cys-rich membrane protein [Lachnospiraceae bacterium]|nr:FeoB-associated Cys-rich membrane protein [Lachnospiraceae bacterium]
MNPADLVILLIVCAVVFLALRRIIKNTRRGGCGCCGGDCTCRQKECCRTKAVPEKPGKALPGDEKGKEWGLDQSNKG